MNTTTTTTTTSTTNKRKSEELGDGKKKKEITTPPPLPPLKMTQDEITLFRNTIEPVLNEEESRPLILAPVYVVTIEPSQASNMMDALAKVFNNEITDQDQFTHIKKIKRVKEGNNYLLQMFVCSQEFYPSLMDEYNQAKEQQDTTPQQVQDITVVVEKQVVKDNNNNNNNVLPTLKHKLITFLKSNRLALSIVNIPKYQPLELTICSEWTKVYWPCIFKAYYFTTPLVHSLEDRDIIEMKYYMGKALEQAAEAKRLGYRPVGAVLVDPKTNEIVMSAHDRMPTKRSDIFKIENNTSNPLLLSPIFSHCTMNIVHLIANSQLDEIKSIAISNQEKEQQNNQNNNNNNIIGNPNDIDQYLANNLCLYITREPCVMCAMALVHSRIKRVVYGTNQPNGGGLGSCFKINTEKSTNHRFEVYKGCLNDQCQSLFDSCEKDGGNNNNVDNQVDNNK